MPQLTRHDRGAVATVVAILLAGGVLLGFLALVVDIGQIYVEREELQTGADAAALAVAKACAATAAPCGSERAVVDLAQSYADANAADGRSRVVAVCGRLAGRLAGCEPGTGNLTECLGGDPPSTPYVEVRLATELADGSLVLPPVFAQSMAGNSGFDGASVGACARATWQVPVKTPILGLALSTCDWDAMTRGRPADPDNPQPSDERVLFLEPARGNCAGDQPDFPWQRPGPPAWLDADASCEVHLPLAKVLTGHPLAPVAGTCVSRLQQAAIAHETVYLPVYDKAHGPTPDRSYHIAYFAPFVVTGFVAGTDASQQAPSWLTAGPPCQPGTLERCVSGVFVGSLVPVSTLAGNSLVTLIG